MPVLLNGYLKGLIGLTRHNEISAEFAFRGSNLFLVSKRCLSAKSAARRSLFSAHRYRSNAINVDGDAAGSALGLRQ